MYFNTDSQGRDEGVLQSPMYTGFPGLTRYHSFFYHMSGPSIGSLNVWIKTRSYSSLVWSKAGDQGNNWNFDSIEISSTTPYQVLYSAGNSTSISTYIHAKYQCSLCMFLVIPILSKYQCTTVMSRVKPELCACKPVWEAGFYSSQASIQTRLICNAGIPSTGYVHFTCVVHT